MLASIHPLGERARRQRWGVTVGAFLAGAVAGSALMGAVLGLAGSALGRPGRTASALVVTVLAAVGAAADLGRVPASRRLTIAVQAVVAAGAVTVLVAR